MEGRRGGGVKAGGKWEKGEERRSGVSGGWNCKGRGKEGQREREWNKKELEVGRGEGKGGQTEKRGSAIGEEGGIVLRR